MKNDIQNRSDILQKYIFKWKKATGYSRESISMCVLEAVERLNLTDALAEVGVVFVKTRDHLRDQKHNAQKLFRWIDNDGHAHTDEKLFHVEQAIVAAMPDEIRVDYLNEVYADCGAVITAPHKTTHQSATILDALATFVKEGGEANSVVIHLLGSDDPNDRKNTLRELEEASVALTNVIAAVKSDKPKRVN